MPVLFTVPLTGRTLKNPSLARLTRCLTQRSSEDFSTAYHNVRNCLESVSTLHNLDADAHLNLFNSTCADIMNSIAPLRYKNHKPVPVPWHTDTTRTLRRVCRQAERQWKKDHLQVSYEIMKNAYKVFQKAAKSAKCKHFSELISNNCHKPQVLFATINSVLNPSVHPILEPSTALCDNFAKLFVDKITLLRSQLSNSVYTHDVPLCSSIWSEFESIDLDTCNEIVGHLKPTICPQDIIPPSFLRQIMDTVGPGLLLLINKCLSTGSFPNSLKVAVVTPYLKKTNLDPSTLSNYRPISNLPFISKILERVVLIQLQSYLSANSLHETFQSGFKALHSTESALLRVSSDIFTETDSGKSMALVLLDLSSAFDLVDHEVLLRRLETSVGFRGVVLQWFRSYLNNRCFSVRIGHQSSTSVPLNCGVPQGSILGPILFILYLLPLASIFNKYEVSFHLYADDTQVYFPLKHNDKNGLQPLFACLSDLKLWLSSNFLNLNENKTEIIIFGPKENCVFDVERGSLAPYETHCARNLGFLFDHNLKFEKQISAVVKSCFFQLRQLSKVKPFLTQSNLQIVIHAFVTSRLDYCNSLYFGLSQSSLSRLQLVQNAAARLLTGTRKYESITPILFKLHWLPVKFRIDFKILLFVYKALNNLAPQYLTDLLCPYTPSRTLRSSDHCLLIVPRSRLKKRGDRAFAAAGPKLWNSLPLYIRLAPSVSIFKSSLKTFLFSLAFHAY